MPKISLIALLLLTFSVAAEEEGSIGFSAAVSVSGFFSPELKEVTVDEVFEDSAADAAGLKSGDKILSIEDCAIPGCDAKKAKKMMKRAPGETLNLLIEDEHGEQRKVAILVK